RPYEFQPSPRSSTMSARHTGRPVLLGLHPMSANGGRSDWSDRLTLGKSDTDPRTPPPWRPVCVPPEPQKVGGRTCQVGNPSRSGSIPPATGGAQETSIEEVH